MRYLDHPGVIFSHSVNLPKGFLQSSAVAVQEHLGHTTLTMTQKYAHLSPEFQKAEVDRLNGVFLNHIPAKKEIDLTNENIVAGNA